MCTVGNINHNFSTLKCASHKYESTSKILALPNKPGLEFVLIADILIQTNFLQNSWWIRAFFSHSLLHAQWILFWFWPECSQRHKSICDSWNDLRWCLFHLQCAMHKTDLWWHPHTCPAVQISKLVENVQIKTCIIFLWLIKETSVC